MKNKYMCAECKRMLTDADVHLFLPTDFETVCRFCINKSTVLNRWDKIELEIHNFLNGK